MSKTNKIAPDKINALLTQTQQKRPQLAHIREAECIGCTKCITACPVDAIIGGAKQMHTILRQECIGCELCVPACPVDCITMQSITIPHYVKTKAIQRHQAKCQREAAFKKAKKLNHQQATLSNTSLSHTRKLAAKKAYILAAVARVKSKKDRNHGQPKNQ